MRKLLRVGEMSLEPVRHTLQKSITRVAAEGVVGAVFAVLHIGPGKRFLPWTLSAFVLERKGGSYGGASP